MREVARGEKPYLRKSTDCKAQIRKAFVQFSGLICALRSVDFFSGKVFHPEPPHAQSLFLFPIVFGINFVPPIEKLNQINTKKLLEIEKEIVREVARGDKPYLRKSTDRKAQSRKAFAQFSGLICALRSVDFLR